MDKDKKWFKEQDWDLQELPNGHRSRFLEKLQQATSETASVTDTEPKVRSLQPWFKWSLVAGLALLVGISAFNFNTSSSNDLSDVSPELAETQAFFTSAIQTELAQLEKEKSPETQRLVADTKSQLNDLEQEYRVLKNNLIDSGYNKTVVAAMIQNFQARIDLLETAMQHIESFKELKQLPDEITL